MANLDTRTTAAGRRPPGAGFRLALAGAVAVLLTALAVPAGAAPAAGSGANTAAAIHTRSSCNSRICLQTRYDGYFGHNVRGMTAWLKYQRRGHFQFFGPAGHIANSDNRTWIAYEAFDYNRFMTGNSDALWCARFWVYHNGHWDDDSGIVCTNSG